MLKHTHENLFETGWGHASSNGKTVGELAFDYDFERTKFGLF